MSNEDWYRKERWSPRIEKNFFDKLGRARSQRDQYLVIQAVSLVATAAARSNREAVQSAIDQGCSVPSLRWAARPGARPLDGGVMPEAPRKDPLRRLGDAMSDISEECWHAGWEESTEHALPELCRRAAESDEPQPWGDSLVTPGQARELIELARRAGSWADIDDGGIGYVRFDPWPVPQAILDDLERHKRFAGKRRAKQPPPRIRRAGGPTITEYVVANYHHLMTDIEKLAYKKLLVEQKSIGTSPRLANALREQVGDVSPELESALSEGAERFIARVAERVLREHADEVLLNRCPRCDALCRTPRAKLCPECHHAWHSEAAG